MPITPEKMCFGLTEELDRESFVCFLETAGHKNFATTLAKRLSSEEILEFVDSFTMLLRRHLSEDEYHRIFLQDSSHSHHAPHEE